MTLLIVSFIAGVLTVAAPCILPLLPVIIGGSIIRTGKSAEKQWYRPLIITGSLLASIVIFTLLLKATTALLDVPQMFWQILAGGIVVLFGITLVLPSAWEKVSAASGLSLATTKLFGSAGKKRGLGGDIALGAALGPIFSSCSPTYSLIVATVLPVSFAQGLLYLLAYGAGLAGILLLIAYFGQSVVARLGWLSNPRGWFKKAIGVLFIMVGIVVMFGIDKQIQAYVLENGWYDPISQLERQLESRE